MEPADAHIDTDLILGVLASLGHDPRLVGTRGTIRLDVGPHSVVITLGEGALSCRRGPGEAEIVARIDEADFREIALGRRNALCAAMQGRIELSGNLARLGMIGRVLAVLSERLHEQHLDHEPGDPRDAARREQEARVQP